MTTNAPHPPGALTGAETLDRLCGLLAPIHIDAGAFDGGDQPSLDVFS